jgi:hypothetical protein
MPRALAIWAGLLAAGPPGAGGGELVRVHHGGPSAGLTLSPGGGQAGHGALVDDVPLELALLLRGLRRARAAVPAAGVPRAVPASRACSADGREAHEGPHRRA